MKSKIDQILSYEDKLKKLSDMEVIEVYLRSVYAKKGKHLECFYLEMPMSAIIDIKKFDKLKNQKDFWIRLIGVYKVEGKEIKPQNLKEAADALRKYFAHLLQGCSGVLEVDLINNYLEKKLKQELKV